MRRLGRHVLVNFNLSKHTAGMRYLRLFLLCVGCAVSTFAQTLHNNSGAEMSTGEDELYAPLQLMASVIEKRYCSDNRARLNLRLNFTNTGKESIILDKRSSVIPQFMVSRNFKAAAARKYEIQGHLLIRMDSALMSLGSSLDESLFVILKPGESYSLDGVLNLPLYNGTGNSEDSLRPGNHVLEIIVLTWYYPRASNIRWREQWRQKGYLRSDPAVSIPMSFAVEKKRTVVGCPS